MVKSSESLRRDAKALRKGFAAGDAAVMARVRDVLPDVAELRHVDALHVLAREAGFESWPKLKFAEEARAMDRAEKAERLKMALYHGQVWVIERLLAETPELARDNFGLMCALYDVDGVVAAIARDPKVALTAVGPRMPILHLAFSRWHQGPGKARDMFQVGELLVEAGADVNQQYDSGQGMLSALYGAIGHGQNLPLAEWLLKKGADPNDGESLYHACDAGNAEGLRLLFAHGAKPERTNALPRALDFNNIEMVEVLLEGGADPNEGIHWPEESGEAPWVIPALHQAARRMCDREIGALLLDAGADPAAVAYGHSAYAFARIFGNDGIAEEIAARGGVQPLSADEAIIAEAVAGRAVDAQVRLENLPETTRDMVRLVLHLPGGLEKVKALVAAGMPFDRPDPQGLTAVQIAGWEGLAEVMEYLLSLGPDLSHVNGYGGTLLSTIIHGSENAPDRSTRDHIACARLALEAGVDLPRRAVAFAGEPEMAAFLEGWALEHPEQVTEEGVG